MKIAPKTAYIVKLFFYFKSALMFHSFLKKYFFKKVSKTEQVIKFFRNKKRGFESLQLDIMYIVRQIKISNIFPIFIIFIQL